MHLLASDANRVANLPISKARFLRFAQQLRGKPFGSSRTQTQLDCINIAELTDKPRIDFGSRMDFCVRKPCHKCMAQMEDAFWIRTRQARTESFAI